MLCRRGVALAEVSLAVICGLKRTFLSYRVLCEPQNRCLVATLNGGPGWTSITISKAQGTRSDERYRSVSKRFLTSRRPSMFSVLR